MEKKNCNYDEQQWVCVEPEKKKIIRNCSFIIHWKIKCRTASEGKERDKFWMCGYKHISSNYPVESPWFQSKKQQINAQCMVRRWWWSVDEHNKSNFMFLCNFSTWFHAHEPQRFFFLALFPYLTSRAHRTNKKNYIHIHNNRELTLASEKSMEKNCKMMMMMRINKHEKKEEAWRYKRAIEVQGNIEKWSYAQHNDPRVSEGEREKELGNKQF